MPRGGRRSGAPAKAYSQRTDLAMDRSPTSVAADAPYGQGAELQAAQSAVPVGPPPGGVTPLNAPTQRPDEPLTAGLSTGPGPGPEALQAPSAIEGMKVLSQKNRQYLDYLAGMDDLPPRVALAVTILRNSQ